MRCSVSSNNSSNVNPNSNNQGTDRAAGYPVTRASARNSVPAQAPEWVRLADHLHLPPAQAVRVHRVRPAAQVAVVELAEEAPVVGRARVAVALAVARVVVARVVVARVVAVPVVVVRVAMAAVKVAGVPAALAAQAQDRPVLAAPARKSLERPRSKRQAEHPARSALGQPIRGA
jgi:hypothetical protein